MKQTIQQKYAPTIVAYWNDHAWILTAAIVAIAVFTATLINRNIGYANGAGCDSWYFFGIYQDYFHLRSILGDKYQFDRYPAILPWIFLGPRISATFLTEIKFWTYFLISSACFSYSATKLFGTKIGPFVFILFCCSTLFLGPLSTDFVTAAGLAWESAFIASSIHAAMSPRPALWLFVSGIFCALCIYSHIPMAMFIFSTPLYLLLRVPTPTIKVLIGFTISLFVGFITATIVFCVVSVFLGGHFLFFLNELLSAFVYVKTNYYQRPIADTLQWFAYDSNIPIFLLAATAAIATLISLSFRRSMTRPYNLVLPPIIYLATAALCFGFEFSGRMVLQENVFAPWLLPSAFLAIGAALSIVRQPRKEFWPVMCLVALCLLTWSASRRNPSIAYYWGYIFASGSMLSLLLPLRAWSPILSASCTLALLAIEYPTGYGSMSWYPDSWNGRALYEIVKQSDRFIARHSKMTIPTFWISGDVGGANDPLFASIARSFLKCVDFAGSYPSVKAEHNSWNQYLPSLAEAVRDHYVAPGQELFIIARGRNLVASTANAFSTVGLKATPIAETVLAPGLSIAVAKIQ